MSFLIFGRDHLHRSNMGIVSGLSNRVLKMFERPTYTELFLSLALILVNLHSLAPSNAYDEEHRESKILSRIVQHEDGHGLLSMKAFDLHGI